MDRCDFISQISLREKSNVFYFGEIHNNTIAHWLQVEIIKALQAKGHELVIGMEMFETDNQEGLDKYLSGVITEDSLEKHVRLWSNFESDYLPILMLAKEFSFPIIATNIPRRYAKAVYAHGLGHLQLLPESDRQWIARLPIDYNPELPGYKAMLDMVTEGHNGDRFPMSQAIKDATMADAIVKNFDAGKLYMHINGNWHSDNHGKKEVQRKVDGIPGYISKSKPEWNQLTIRNVVQADINFLAEEHLNTADIVLVVDKDLPNSN